MVRDFLPAGRAKRFHVFMPAVAARLRLVRFNAGCFFADCFFLHCGVLFVLSIRRAAPGSLFAPCCGYNKPECTPPKLPKNPLKTATNT